MTETGHGDVGTREQPFTSILPPNHPGYEISKLAALAELMKAKPDDVNDGPDPEENIWVPAGYTYFGQFIDHDLTFDSTSTLNPEDTNSPGAHDRIPTNLRTPRLDLDCVYGDGPAAQPFMYASDGATLLLGDFELARASNGLAIIGDKRNDENSIVCQIQLGFIRFHNAVVALLAKDATKSSWSDKSSLFNSAQNEVRWTYQKLILEDFLPRIIDNSVLQDLYGKTRQERHNSYVFFTENIRSNLPREFVAAAYRFGHSGVREGYRLNNETKRRIFPGSVEDPSSIDSDSLLGFEPLPKHHLIDDWGRFFSEKGPGPDTDEDRTVEQKDDPKVRLQFAYKLDPTIVDPLAVLPPVVAGGAGDEAAKLTSLPDKKGRPSLALLNLLRGNAYHIHSGQAYASILKKKFPHAPVPLDHKHLVVRVAQAKDGEFKFVSVDEDLRKNTPLWFYVLAEAQAGVVDFVAQKMQKSQNGVFDEGILLTGDGAKTQLGWVGGRIVGEVMYGLIDSDTDSFVNKAPVGWKPMISDKGPLIVKRLLNFAASVV